MERELFIDWSPDSRDHAALLRSLVRDNTTRGGPTNHRNIAIIVRDPETGEVSSGVWGGILYGWLFIELLYVAEPDRRQGLGSRLLTAVEAAAREQGCIGAWLSSYAFQAPGFYKKNGYEEFGELGNSAAKDAPDNRLCFSESRSAADKPSCHTGPDALNHAPLWLCCCLGEGSRPGQLWSGSNQLSIRDDIFGGHPTVQEILRRDGHLQHKIVCALGVCRIENFFCQNG